MDEMCAVAKKWLPPITEDDKIAVMDILTGPETTFGIPLLRKYIEMLEPYIEVLGINSDKLREADCLASGIVFFYGCLCYIMHFPGWGRYIRDIFLYNILYILVDHYIDDINVNKTTKDIAISQMFMIIENPEIYKKLSLIDPILETIAITYEELLQRCPSVKDPLIKLFQVEIEGLKIQKSCDFTREDYYNIALKKGGYTMEVLYYIVGSTDVKIKDASYHIGTIMQLIDDSVDVMADKKNVINTIATYDLENKGLLDDLWIDIMDRISKIDGHFTPFIILYTIFAVYLPDRMCHNYSDKLISRTNPLNLFDYGYGCDGSLLLVEAIMGELTAIQILR